MGLGICLVVWKRVLVPVVQRTWRSWGLPVRDDAAGAAVDSAARAEDNCQRSVSRTLLAHSLAGAETAQSERENECVLRGGWCSSDDTDCAGPRRVIDVCGLTRRLTMRGYTPLEYGSGRDGTCWYVVKPDRRRVACAAALVR